MFSRSSLRWRSCCWPDSTSGRAGRCSVRTPATDALDALNLLRSELQGTIDANIQLVQGLVGVVEYEPDLDQAHFEQLGARIVRGRDEILAVSAAPGMVVSMMYPIEGHEVVIGLDLLKTAGAAPGGADGAGARHHGAGRAGRPGGGRPRLHRAHAGFHRRRAAGPPVLGNRLDGDRPGCAVPGGRAHRSRPADRGGDRGARRAESRTARPSSATRRSCSRTR